MISRWPLYSIYVYIGCLRESHRLDDPIDVGAHFGVDRARVRRAVESAEARYAEQVPLVAFGVGESTLAHQRPAAVALATVSLQTLGSARAHHRLRVVEAERQRAYANLVVLDGHLALLDALYLLVVVLVCRAEACYIAYGVGRYVGILFGQARSYVGERILVVGL